MTANAIVDGLLAIEERVADQDWRYKGVDVWPLYRSEIRGRLSIVSIGAATDVRKPPRLLDLASGWERTAGPAVDGSCTIVMNDGFSLQRIGHHMMDRLCTPICLGLSHAGVAHVLLDQGSSPTIDLAERVEPIGAMVLRAKIKAFALTKLRLDPWVAGRCRQLAEAAAAVGIDPVAIPDAWAMSARQGAMLDLAEQFERLLHRLRAERVLQVCYYTIAGYAMNLAAHRVGIDAVDIQHGVIVEQHTSYASWPRLPVGGYSLMPTGYWTWSETEARIIRDGLKLADDAVVVSGHPLVEAWKAGWLLGTETARDEMRALRAAREEPLHALITLQPGLMGEDSLRPALDAMVTNPDVFWWVRAHPASLDKTAAVTALLNRVGGNYNIVDATRLPLYALLENVDVHLTHSSSTVIEAAQFGVPSLLWSTYGEELFLPYIESGVASVGMNAQAVDSFLRAGQTNSTRRSGSVGADRLTEALETLSR